MKRALVLAFILTRAVLALTPGQDGVPLFFIANQSQSPSPVRFMVKPATYADPLASTATPQALSAPGPPNRVL
jgi:hypothetical protein